LTSSQDSSPQNNSLWISQLRKSIAWKGPSVKSFLSGLDSLAKTSPKGRPQGCLSWSSGYGRRGSSHLGSACGVGDPFSAGKEERTRGDMIAYLNDGSRGQ